MFQSLAANLNILFKTDVHLWKTCMVSVEVEPIPLHGVSTLSVWKNIAFNILYRKLQYLIASNFSIFWLILNYAKIISYFPKMKKSETFVTKVYLPLDFNACSIHHLGTINIMFRVCLYQSLI